MLTKIAEAQNTAILTDENVVAFVIAYVTADGVAGCAVHASPKHADRMFDMIPDIEQHLLRIGGTPRNTLGVEHDKRPEAKTISRRGRKVSHNP